jgi:hypothetical protein
MDNHVPPSDPILAQREGADVAVWKGLILSHAWQAIQLVRRILEALYCNNFYNSASKPSRGKVPRPPLDDAKRAEGALLGYAGCLKGVADQHVLFLHLRGGQGGPLIWLPSAPVSVR